MILTGLLICLWKSSDGFTNFLPKPYQRPVAKMHKSVPCYTIQALAWLCKLIIVSHYSSNKKRSIAYYILSSFATLPCIFLRVKPVSRTPHGFYNLRFRRVLLYFLPDTVNVYRNCCAVARIIKSPYFFKKLFL